MVPISSSRANLHLTQRVIRKWVDEGTAGRMFFVSSMGGRLTAHGLGAYRASKRALEAVAASLCDELAPTGHLADDQSGGVRHRLKGRHARRT